MNPLVRTVSVKPVTFLAATARTTTETGSGIAIPPGVTAITFISDQNTVTGTSPTIDVCVEFSLDNSTWFGIARFAQQTAANEAFLTIPFHGNPSMSQTHSTNWLGGTAAEKAVTGGVINDVAMVCPPYIRVIATVGGTNPSFNGQVLGLMQSSF